MRLNQQTDYALRVLTFVALCEELVTIREISEAFDISKNHLMKVVQHLVRAGYVESIRGRRGGLRLSLAPHEICIGDVVRDVEPDFALVECLKDRNKCVISPVCKLRGLLEKSRIAFFRELDQVTLHDLLPRGVKKDLVGLLDIG